MANIYNVEWPLEIGEPLPRDTKVRYCALCETQGIKARLSSYNHGDVCEHHSHGQVNSADIQRSKPKAELKQHYSCAGDRIHGNPFLDKALAAVCTEFNLIEEELIDTRIKRLDVAFARKILIYILRMYGGADPGPKEVGRWLGGWHYSTVSTAYTRICKLLEKEDEPVRKAMSNVAQRMQIGQEAHA